MSLNSNPLRMFALLSGVVAALMLRISLARNPHDGERGDVPGWVMITLMSAVLVAGLLALAQDQLAAMFQDAMGRITG